MNLSEFKAWFEGFSEGIDKTPSAKQWAKINEKIAAIKPEPTKVEYIREYYDRYRPYYPPYWWNTVYGGVGVAYAAADPKFTAAAQPDFSNCKMLTLGTDSLVEGHDAFAAEAFKAMGRSEFASLNS